MIATQYLYCIVHAYDAGMRLLNNFTMLILNLLLAICCGDIDTEYIQIYVIVWYKLLPGCACGLSETALSGGGTYRVVDVGVCDVIVLNKARVH